MTDGNKCVVLIDCEQINRLSFSYLMIDLLSYSSNYPSIHHSCNALNISVIYEVLSDTEVSIS